VLHSNAVLHFADETLPYYIACDSSQYAIGVCLFQKDKYGRNKYISFLSKTLTPSQQKWGVTRRELYAIVFAIRKYYEFIYAKKVTILCDHKALIYLNQQKTVNPMMAGWIETLLSVNFDVVYIPGVLNTLPDKLSRLYPSRYEYKLEGNENIINNRKNNLLLYKKKDTNNNVTNNNNKHKTYIRSINILATVKETSLDYICPPENKRDNILKEAHNFGHFNAESMIKTIHDDGLHWNNIYKEAAEVAKSCIDCARHNIQKKGYHPIRPIMANLPMDHIAFDLAGPLPISNDKNVYLFVLIDLCTRYIIVRAIPNKQSVTIAKELVQIFGDYGIPRIIQSDNGNEFRNSLMKDITMNLGIQSRFSTPYHPRGNGAAEMAVKNVLNTLRKMVKSNNYDWDMYLPMVQLSINYKIRDRTGSAAFSLMHARKLNPLKNYNNETQPDKYLSVKELEERILKMQNIVFPAIAERTKRILEEQAKQFNSKHKLINIPPNTIVMVKLPHRNSKLGTIF
jgi:hypothetical protein